MKQRDHEARRGSDDDERYGRRSSQGDYYGSSREQQMGDYYSAPSMRADEERGQRQNWAGPARQLGGGERGQYGGDRDWSGRDWGSREWEGGEGHGGAGYSGSNYGGMSNEGGWRGQ